MATLPFKVRPDSDGEVGDPFTSDLPEVIALVVEHLHAGNPVVADEDLALVVHGDAVGELEVSRTRELAQHITDHVEDHDPHHLALDHDGAPPGEDGHTSRVLDWTVQYSWPGAGPVSADPYTTKTTCCSEGCGLVRLRFFLRHKQLN